MGNNKNFRRKFVVNNITSGVKYEDISIIEAQRKIKEIILEGLKQGMSTKEICKILREKHSQLLRQAKHAVDLLPQSVNGVRKNYFPINEKDEKDVEVQI